MLSLLFSWTLGVTGRRRVVGAVSAIVGLAVGGRAVTTGTVGGLNGDSAGKVGEAGRLVVVVVGVVVVVRSVVVVVVVVVVLWLVVDSVVLLVLGSWISTTIGCSGVVGAEVVAVK